MDLVVMPFHDAAKAAVMGWGRRDLQLVRHLALRGHRILVVNRPTSIVHRALGVHRAWGRTPQREELSAPHPRSRLWRLRHFESLYVLDWDAPILSPSIALGRGWWPRILRHPELCRAIEAAIEAIEFVDPILCAFTPIAYPVAEQLPWRVIAFDAIDDWVVHPAMACYRTAAARGYRVFAKRAHLLTGVSVKLAAVVQSERVEFIQLCNGVDCSHFTPDGPESQALEKFPRPLIGHIGYAEDRIDACLVAKIAARFTDGTVLFVGPSKRRIRTALRRFRNVVFLSARPYDAVPELWRSLDVGVVPYLVNRFSNSMSPLKVMEALACGVPIVTTSLAGVQSGAPLTDVTCTHDDFISAISRRLQHVPGAGERESGVRLAHQCDWTLVAQSYEELLHQAVSRIGS